MIVDGFTFFNELDLLEIRLVELYPVVDRFVIVEGDMTFRGRPKTANFIDNVDRYRPFLDKIVYLTALLDNAPGLRGSEKTDPWQREYFQRNYIVNGFSDLEPDDIVLISDVDEIPRRSAIENLVVNDRQVTLAGRRFVYGVNMEEGITKAIKAVKFGHFTTAQQERMMPPTTVVSDAGWEFSSIGTPEQISYKLRNFSHAELDLDEYTSPDKIRERILSGRDLYDRHSHVKRVEIDDTWPEAIKTNREKYRHLEW